MTKVIVDKTSVGPKRGPKPPAHGGSKTKPFDWLAPLSPAKVKQQATSTIKSAYGPSYQSLDQQTKQTQAISDKRSADNKYYQDWLDQQEQALQAHADAANHALSQAEGQLTTEQQGLYSSQPGSLIAAANARAGNVSNNNQSTAANSDLVQNEAANEAALASEAQSATQGVGTENAALENARANNVNVMQAARSKQIADLQTAMTGIANARSKLGTSEQSDIAKEIARLNGIEISKAQSNRSFGAAAEKLGIQAANTASEIQTRGQNAATSAGHLKLDKSTAKFQQMNSDRNYKLNVAKYNQAVAKDIYQREHGLGPYKVSHGGGQKPLSVTSQNAIYNRVTKVRGELESLIGQGYTPQQAWGLLHSGGNVATPAGASGKPGTRRITAVGDDGLLNAAFNTRSGAGGLTSGDIKYLKKLGLVNPGSRLPVVPNYSSSQNYQGPH